MLNITALQEIVPVWSGRFSLVRDLTIGQNQESGP
jgi:hypothetical protein